MEANNLRLALQLIPKLPLMLRVVLANLLGLSESSQYLDVRSDVLLSVMRSILTRSTPRPIGKVQAMTLKDPGIKGRIWISKVVADVPPENDVRDALMGAVEAMKEPRSSGEALREPAIEPVEAEWTGYRAGAGPDDPLPMISETEKYHEMMKECKRKSTVLYFHGGAYYLCDPATHRQSNKKLAKLTGGRVYSVRYRLAPQNPFPAAVLDALISYLTLLYPPPGAVHEPVSPSDIVFAGDSAGGNLSLALLQTVLELRRQNRQITWFGELRSVPLPGGVAVNSPWLCIVQSMPSWDRNSQWDYLPPARMLESKQPPPDHAWPATPPRKHLYVDDAYMLHPLVSLQLNATWKESPPIYMCTGWECLADEDRYLAAKLKRDGVQVVMEEYEAMPHVFAMLLGHIKEARRCMEGWSQFIVKTTEEPEKIESSFTTIKARTLAEVAIEVDKLTPYSDADVQKLAYDCLGKEAPPLPEALAKL
ncbi:alpha/beta hydrolase fold-domain-containing protein [Microdochium trichocladiopsis]|uniref:Alpha/beta hydrolase fold-domain-containing protein n=1 Tax=Microdochium trichocladiopsis TaxID=1682393 RepID=A0A9P8Y2X0_9PEZI|nr:alpha/beta hydrolase fold-domain-containing protein [Microdochium trichocladiopsis]KAH7027874.1 alpha/beta hydrolase fold-domain-containing protein [Microdochium trichocladiopsis]